MQITHKKKKSPKFIKKIKITPALRKSKKKKKRKKRKERKKEEATLLPKKKGNWCRCSWAFLSIKKKCIPNQFSPYFGEKTFWEAQGENKWISSFIFFSPYSTKHTLKKNFLPIFFPQFSIYHVSPPNKHTLNVRFRSISELYKVQFEERYPLINSIDITSSLE